MRIHPSAIVDPAAEVHASVEIGPYSVIDAGVVIGADCLVGSNVRIHAGATIGARNRFDHGAVIGGDPQDLSYAPDKGRPLVIGDDNRFREGVNVSRGVKSEHGTRIGNHNYLMAMSHVAHDCLVGDHNILANSATLGGHCELEHHIFLSGLTAVHQFGRIGAYALLSGLSGASRDVPPYALADGHRAEVVGLNVVGLRRAGLGPDARRAIKHAYRVLYRSGLRQQEALDALQRGEPTPEVQHLIDFVRASQRGIIAHR